MPRPIGTTATPKYRLHRPSGQAVVTLSGRDCYLGPWQSKASRTEYDRLIAEWLAAGRQCVTTASDLTMTELMARYWEFAQDYFVNETGHTGPLDNLQSALKKVRQLYGHTLAINFGPIALRAVRDAMIEANWARTFVNSQIGSVRRMFKWGIGRELLPPVSLQALQAVEGLRFGKSQARESEPIKPVHASMIDAVLPHVSAHIRAMIELQRHSGMRSAELCTLRGCDIDMTGEIWIYRPAQHKTRHRGQEREVHLGDRCREVIAPFLKTDLSAFLFSPAEAESARRAALNASRNTPASCGNTVGTNRKSKPAKRPGDRYTTSSFRRAVATGCVKAFPMPKELIQGLSPDEAKAKAKAWRRKHQWHPHQVRHTFATAVRKAFGLEAAQSVLGHQSLSATQIYAEKSFELAKRVAAEVG